MTSLDKPDFTIDAIWLEEAQKRLNAHQALQKDSNQNPQKII